MLSRLPNKIILAAFIEASNTFGESTTFSSWDSFSWTVTNLAHKIAESNEEPYIVRRTSVAEAMACARLCDFIWWGYLAREGAADAEDTSIRV